MKHKYGLYLGRFQPFHDGHEFIVKEALNYCDNLIIAIGSAQEERTKINPLSFMEKGVLIKVLTSYNPHIRVIPINDRDEYADNASWGSYVLDEVEKATGVRPTVVFEGAEETNQHWYDDDADIKTIRIRRDILPISATQIRQFILDDDKEAFKDNMPAGLWGFYNDLREIMLEVYDGKLSN